MPEAFKNLINPQTIVSAAGHLQRVAPEFDAGSFIAEATAGLEPLEFKARAMHVCTVLQTYLPESFERAAELIEASLAAPTALNEKGEPVGLSTGQSAGISGWIVWSLGEYVVRAGLQQPERALRCLHALTQRFSAEFAIRPFLIAHPEITYATLNRWLTDSSPHVRRLVSEGSRPRLPWGVRLQALVRDPTPSWPLLRALQDDPSAYVRRSVANHLNDIAKDHPDAVAQWLQTELSNAPKSRIALLRHASRSLIKKGHAPTLAAWNVPTGFTGVASLRLQPSQLALGEALSMEVELHSQAEQSQTVVVDYAVHFVLASGKHSAKVFKGWTRKLAPDERCLLQKSHSFKAITTRTYYSGLHRIELLINGQSCGMREFSLRVSTPVKFDPLVPV